MSIRVMMKEIKTNALQLLVFHSILYNDWQRIDWACLSQIFGTMILLLNQSYIEAKPVIHRSIYQCWYSKSHIGWKIGYLHESYMCAFLLLWLLSILFLIREHRVCTQNDSLCIDYTWESIFLDDDDHLERRGQTGSVVFGDRLLVKYQYRNMWKTSKVSWYIT